MKNVVINLCTLLFLSLTIIKCQDDKRNHEIIHIPPSYDSLKFFPTKDTLHFKLAPNTTTSVANSNYFTQNGEGFISFYDKVTKSLSIYRFPSAQLVSVHPLKKWLTTVNLDKSSVYIKNFDSILVCTRDRLILFDTSSLIKKTIEIPSRPIRVPSVNNDTPPVWVNDTLFVNITPSVKETSLSEHRNWRLLFGINFKNGEQNLYYRLPKSYTQDFYGYSFLEYSYCINDKGRFVFSFPVDTNIYETDLSGYNIAYFAKSQFQLSAIPPVSKAAIENNKSFEEYSLRDSYGAILFDPHHKRYFRVAKQKMNKSALRARERIRVRSILMLDENFKVIGEGFFPPNCAFSTAFFTRDGRLYARYNAPGDYQIRYVRIEYDPTPRQVRLAH